MSDTVATLHLPRGLRAALSRLGRRIDAYTLQAFNPVYPTPDARRR